MIEPDALLAIPTGTLRWPSSRKIKILASITVFSYSKFERSLLADACASGHRSKARRLPDKNFVDDEEGDEPEIRSLIWISELLICSKATLVVN